MTGQNCLLSHPLPDTSITPGSPRDTGNNAAHLSLKVADLHSLGREEKNTQQSGSEVWEMVLPDQELTRWQCLITAATSSWLSSFFDMSSTCFRVSGWGSRLSFNPARDSLGEVKSWRVRPLSLSEELKRTGINKIQRKSADGMTHIHSISNANQPIKAFPWNNWHQRDIKGPWFQRQSQNTLNGLHLTDARLTD